MLLLLLIRVYIREENVLGELDIIVVRFVFFVVFIFILLRHSVIMNVVNLGSLNFKSVLLGLFLYLSCLLGSCCIFY